MSMPVNHDATSAAAVPVFVDAAIARASRSLAIALLFGGLTLAAAPEAGAQSGSGAERYEVTITPPKRPGSEAVPDAATTAGEPDGAAPDAAPTGNTAADPAVPAPSPSAAPHDGAAPTAAGAVAAPAAGTAVAAPPTRAAANQPLHTLQVGAFRERKSATRLHDALVESFKDVSIVEVQSGGEALYRVNVGHLPHGAALDELKRRVVAAGFAAFEVAAPAAVGAN